MLQLINLTLRRKRELDIKKLKLDLLITIFLIFFNFRVLELENKAGANCALSYLVSLTDDLSQMH